MSEPGGPGKWRRLLQVSLKVGVVLFALSVFAGVVCIVFVVLPILESVQRAASQGTARPITFWHAISNLSARWWILSGLALVALLPKNPL